MNKRQKNLEILKKNYDKAAAIVESGNWSQEAIDRATAARMVWAGYATWVDSNPPAGATHPTEEFL